jgi:hypothetical protein
VVTLLATMDASSMSRLTFAPWRAAFAACAVLILLGGPRHPGGTMEQMLADPAWVPSHALMLAGFAALLVALILWRRSGAGSGTLSRWYWLAVFGAALQTVEMALHTAAVVDLGHLRAGQPTPVLSTHMTMVIFGYPLFALAISALIVAAAHQRSLGSWWIAPIGIVGALMHGAAGALVAGLGLERFRVLFLGAAVFALWSLLAALWPVRAPAPARPMAAVPREPAAAAAR